MFDVLGNLVGKSPKQTGFTQPHKPAAKLGLEYHRQGEGGEAAGISRREKPADPSRNNFPQRSQQIERDQDEGDPLEHSSPARPLEERITQKTTMPMSSNSSMTRHHPMATTAGRSWRCWRSTRVFTVAGLY